MTERVYGFDEDSFRRVQEATRRVLRSPTTGSQRRRQVPVMGSDGTGSGGGGGDSGSCGCDDGVEVGVVDIGGINYAASYTFYVTELSMWVTVTYDEELEYWVSDTLTLTCPADPE